MAVKRSAAVESEAIDADTPTANYRRLMLELEAAKESFRRWHEQGERIVKRYLDERDDGLSKSTRWNLFTSNVDTKMATLYGKVPKVTVSRRHADSTDDVARVAGEMMERLLNTDIEREDDTYALAMRYVLEDHLVPGLGMSRVRYDTGEMQTQPGTPAKLAPDGRELAPAVPEVETRPDETAETDYVHWKDVLWNKSRVWHEVRVIFFRALMSRKELVKRFGAVGKLLPLNANKRPAESEKRADPWEQAEVWECWDKVNKTVYWLVEGYTQTVDSKPDPLQLDGFWPCARPLIAGCTTSSLMPRPEFVITQDLYDEIDLVSTKVKLLEDAVRVSGAYDKNSPEVKNLLKHTGSNQLYPAENWAMFSEKGGFKGVIDWMPLDQIVSALTALRDYRNELINALHQITGMSDIMRGQSSGPAATAHEQSIKAKFGSVRLQRMQDEFARFCSDTQKLKAEIIAKHFDVQTIIQRSNILMTPDAQFAQQAAQLIKDKLSAYRIEVKPEAVSLTDFAQLKQDRTEVIAAMSQFITSATPLIEKMPAATPGLLKMLQWLVSGMRGASQIEGVIDQMIEGAESAPPPAGPQEDPKEKAKILAIQMKSQADMAKADKDLQNDMVRTQLDVQAEEAKQKAQMQYNLEESVQQAKIKHAFTPPMPPNGKPR